MARTNAERQAARWERLRSAARERDQLRGQVGALAADLERTAAELVRLETELAEALAGRTAGRCPACGTQLACPRCYRGEAD